MSGLLGNRWFRLGAGALVIAIAGFVATFAGVGGFQSNDGYGADTRVAFAYSTVPGGPQDLPLSVDEAVTAGWSGSTLCIPSRGRFYRRLAGDDSDPLMLLFSTTGGLVGLNLHSATEQPAPWGRSESGIQGVPGRQSSYWDLNIYFIDKTKACVKSLAQGRTRY